MMRIQEKAEPAKEKERESMGKREAKDLEEREKILIEP
jgi:hypothetical protein